jgi:hypothetical protein
VLGASFGLGFSTRFRQLEQLADAVLRLNDAVMSHLIVRILNAPLHPFDYAAAVDEIRAAVTQYQHAAVKSTSNRFSARCRCSATRSAPDAPGRTRGLRRSPATAFIRVGLVREANKVRAILRSARRELSESGKPSK